ncbi:MAG: polyisoprenoid-binding protein [Acidobacteria bacterium]|nr:MAG: polyisoprenoid-binding protein [Acidobacteriota bacterium]
MLVRFILSILTLVVALPAAAGDFAIDTAHSSVGFKVAHLVVSKTRGSFQAFSGRIHLDEENIARSTVAVTIDVASLSTANEKRDEHLRSPDFFDVESHPQITFKSTSVKKSGSGHVAIGELTIRGVSHRVDLPFVVNGPITDPWGNQRIGVQIKPITIDRRDFGLTWSQALETGGLMVGNEIEIEIEVEAVQVKDSTGS